MKFDACRRSGAIGDFNAVLGVQFRIRLARGYNRNAARAKQRPESYAERKGQVFFCLIAELGAGIAAAVGSVENHRETRSSRFGWILGECRKRREACEEGGNSDRQAALRLHLPPAGGAGPRYE